MNAVTIKPALTDNEITAIYAGAFNGSDGSVRSAPTNLPPFVFTFARALIAVVEAMQPFDISHADAEDAARWRFMMRAADDEAGPEASAIEGLDDDYTDDGLSKSLQAQKIVDAARAIVADDAERASNKEVLDLIRQADKP